MFVSNDKRINDFLRMARLISFLEGSANTRSKAEEIKLARDRGLITEEEAQELVIEYC